MNRLVVAACLVAIALTAPAASAQTAPVAAPPAARGEPAKDHLGRDTPRGTVLGFLSAARSGDESHAAQYLNTRLPRAAAGELARQLFVVLDTRLPARLTQLSAQPGGSGADPLEPNRELVGTIPTAGGEVDITLERVKRGTSDEIWLFSRQTLEAVPAVYEEISLISVDTVFPEFLTRTRLAGIRLLDWLAVLLGIPLLYLLTVLLNRLLSPLVGLLWRRVRGISGRSPHDVLPTPVRLLLLAIAIRWFASSVQLSLLARQFWFNASMVIAVAAVAWLLILLNGAGERLARRRVPAFNVAAAVSLLRLGRRVADVFVLFACALVMLRYLGVDPTPALAGLGVGGIAVALAAQKTLENVIAGVSLIVDGAVNEGDFLKVGDTLGAVDHVGLRSTRIRTLDRTVVSVPNSQIANMSLETLSARDSYWFHPVVGLRYETTPEQLRAVVEGIRQLLAGHGAVDQASVRVRFIKLAAFSLDVDVFAYVAARDWSHFLEIQEQLLFAVMDIVGQAGAQVAFPSQTLYVANRPAADIQAGSAGPENR